MRTRTKAREQAIQVLYLIEVSASSVDEALKQFDGNFQTNDTAQTFTKNLVEGVTNKKEELDSMIQKYSDHWRISRMPPIDRNILRLGTYELLYSHDVPVSVALDEAIELAKKYGEQKTSSFINGILDRIAKYAVANKRGS